MDDLLFEVLAASAEQSSQFPVEAKLLAMLTDEVEDEASALGGVPP